MFTISGDTFYLFVETSSPHWSGDTARLINPLVDTRNHNYLRFYAWYSAYGRSLGALKVTLYEDQLTHSEVVLFEERSLVSRQEWLEVTSMIKPTRSFTVSH